MIAHQKNEVNEFFPVSLLFNTISIFCLTFSKISLFSPLFLGSTSKESTNQKNVKIGLDKNACMMYYMQVGKSAAPMEQYRSGHNGHDWKSCVPQKGTEGSNPSCSARTKTPEIERFPVFFCIYG